MISFSVSSRPWGADVFTFQFVHEGVPSLGPASRSKKQQGWAVTPGPLVFWSLSDKYFLLEWL